MQAYNLWLWTHFDSYYWSALDVNIFESIVLYTSVRAVDGIPLQGLFYLIPM